MTAEATPIDPVDAEVDRARLLLELGRSADAEPMLRRALAARPDHYGALTTLAWLLAADERTQEAEAAAAQVIRAYPGDAEGHRRMAWVLRDAGRYTEAEPFAREAVRIDPHDAAGFRALAAVLWNLPGRQAEALAASERAVELAPQEAANLAFESIALVNLRRWEEAAVAAHAALALDPTDSTRLAQCGLINLRLGHGDTARAQFESALRLSPTPDQARDVLQNLETHGVPEPLIDVYRALCTAVGIPDLTVPGAAGTDPGLLDRQTELAGRMFSSAVYNHPWSKTTLDRVGPILAAILAAAPDHVAARQLAAKAADEQDRPEEALAYATGLLADGESSIRLHRYVISALHHLGRLDEALAAADAACRAFPGEAEPLALRAEALLDLRRLDEALTDARAAVALAPRDPDQHCALGRVLRDYDDEPETQEAAKQAFLAALALDPGHVRARFDLGSLRMLAFQDYPRAEEEFLRITIPDPSGERTACLGQVRFLQGKWTEALADFEAALAMPMRTPNTLEIIVTALQYFGGPEPFREVYARSMELLGRPVPEQPATAEPLVGLGFLMVRAGADDKAAALAAAALRLDPDCEDAAVLAQVMAEPDDPEIAETLAGLRYAPAGD